MSSLSPDQMPRASPSTMSRPSHQHLVIRTANSPAQSARPAAPASAPTDPPYPTYPLPIPDEKFAKALKIYTQYRVEEALEQRRLEHSPHGYRQNSLVSGHDAISTTYSVTSYASSRPYTATSLATSAHEEGITDLSSLMSFNEDDERPTSASVRAEAELVAFNGKKVRQRIRRKLSPKAKAKAALVRWLGSCWVCRKRRVPCPFEHLDINALDAAYRKRNNRRHQSQSSHSSNSNQFLSIAESTETPSVQGLSLAEDLRGLGQNEELLQTPNAFEVQPDSQSPGGALLDPLADLPGVPTIKIESASFASLNIPNIESDPYAKYQDGAMLALGVQRGSSFYCQHLAGLCQAFFEDEESLQVHFEVEHFSFERINPFRHLICSQCNCVNHRPSPACSSCGALGSIELWVYGRFKRSPSLGRFDSKSAELLRTAGRHVKFDSSLDSLSGVSPWAPNPGSRSSFSGASGGGGFQYQNGSTYPGPSPNGGRYSYSSHGGSQYSGFRSQSARFCDHDMSDVYDLHTVHEMPLEPLPLLGLPRKSVSGVHHHQYITCILFRLFLLTLLALSLIILRNLSIMHIQPLIHRTHSSCQDALPALGFASIITSGAVSWSANSRGVSRRRLFRCSMHSGVSLSERFLRMEGAVRVRVVH